MTVAVLAVQGAFIEHEKMLQNMGIDTVELRQKEDLNQHFDGIVLPGGESTVQGKLLKELGMFDSLKQRIQSGMPVLATRAPYIAEVAPEVEILAEVEEKIVAVRYKTQLAMAFHPELSGDDRIHREFVRMIG